MKKQTYESAVARLQEIVKLLEAGGISLDDSLKLFEEGAKLAAFCNSELKNAEQKITALEDISENSDKEAAVEKNE